MSIVRLLELQSWGAIYYPDSFICSNFFVFENDQSPDYHDQHKYYQQYPPRENQFEDHYNPNNQQQYGTRTGGQQSRGGSAHQQFLNHNPNNSAYSESTKIDSYANTISTKKRRNSRRHSTRKHSEKFTPRPTPFHRGSVDLPDLYDRSLVLGTFSSLPSRFAPQPPRKKKSNISLTWLRGPVHLLHIIVCPFFFCTEGCLCPSGSASYQCLCFFWRGASYKRPNACTKKKHRWHQNPTKGVVGFSKILGKILPPVT